MTCPKCNGTGKDRSKLPVKVNRIEKGLPCVKFVMPLCDLCGGTGQEEADRA